MDESGQKYKDDKIFIQGKFHAKFEDKIACWIPADTVKDFLEKCRSGKGDLNFVIAKKRNESKNSHYAYVSKKQPSIPNFAEPIKEKFEAPASLEAELEIKDQIPF